MNLSQLTFYLIAAFILGTAVLAVTTTRIFRAAIWLLFSLVGVAALYFFMQVEFVAAVQIIVYVGGVVVLVIFSIFLTHQSGGEMPRPPLRRIIFSLLAVLLGFAFTYNIITEYGFAPVIPAKPFTAPVAAIGEQMLNVNRYGFVLPFEVVSMLLLAAMIGCIVIAMRPTPVAGAQQKQGTAIGGNGKPVTGTAATVPTQQPVIIEEQTT